MRKAITAVLLLALAGAACQKSGPGTEPSASAPTTVGSPSGTPAGSPASTPASSATKASDKPAPKTMAVKLWYLVAGARGFFLAPETHTVPYSQAVAKAALEELIHGTAQDADHFVPYSRKARIRSVSISNRIATVDWSAEVLRDHQAGSEVEALAIQQVVYTLTEFATIAEVRFTVEGRTRGTASNGADIESWWGHVGLDGQPFERAAYIDTVEPIVLSTPSEAARSSGRITLSGEVVAPGGSHRDVVRIVLFDASGREVVSTHAPVTFVDPYGSQPWRTRFSKTISFTPPATAQSWTVRVAIHNLNDDGIEFAETRTIRVG